MRASVVIRVRDEAAALRRLLGLLAAQGASHEVVVVVDSGSGDGSADVARAAGARLLAIPAAEFSFGGALNLGASVCAAPVVVALSAHAFPRDAGWLERMAAALDDPAVACAFGPERDAGGRPLREAVRQDAASLRATPEWGYSNGAGAFRAALWHERPFRTDMPATEDREWALWALSQRDGICALDPALAVDHDHSGDGLLKTFRRAEREARGYAMFLQRPRCGARSLAVQWWSDQGWHRSPARARLDPRRLARLAGTWRGSR